jgi:hypothetical protein
MPLTAAAHVPAAPVDAIVMLRRRGILARRDAHPAPSPFHGEPPNIAYGYDVVYS